ncbi:hypothetical protein OHAE_2359 [Ochrobactrum soli]|uniref:Uncharacterized protein n=1 Tax=Ochrobactrum soli TaxID=2448455 RepID=A0A2P9HR18_9HYPH|nr:hypothetical protein OHAE_2359 [[Ochrobactrum] soli]
MIARANARRSAAERQVLIAPTSAVLSSNECQGSFRLFDV